MTPIAILGCGYVGTRIARAALAEGRFVRVCARSTGKLAPLAKLGAEVKYLDGGVPKGFTAALNGMAGATVIYSIPPVGTLPPGQAMRAALQAAYGFGAACFIYFSSAGLYGPLPDDEAWIDEETPVALDDPAMSNVRYDEDTILASSFDSLRTTILRLAPVYGPGRGVRQRLRRGEYKLLDDGQHAISRIYVDDVVRVVAAAEQRAPAKSCYLVADDEPTTQLEYARWLCERMDYPMPPSRSMFQPGASRVTHRNRRIRNARMKRELEVELRYPSFREGEAAIEAEETAAAAPAAPPPGRVVSPTAALGLALALAGCRKEEPARQAREAVTAPAPALALAPAAADAGGVPGDAPADAPADAGTIGPEWPASVEVKLVSTQKPISRTFSVDTEVPRFRTTPATLAAELNARFAQYVKRAPDFRGYVGSYYAHCRVELVSRLAVIVDCGEMTDARTQAEAEAAMGGAPAGPQPQRLGVWLQPGLPPIELGQLAPGVDGAAVIARAVTGAPAGCDPRWCEYKPASFTLDAEGVLFRPTTYCALECDAEHQPRIPLDALKPTHPWAVQLVGWIRRRTDAGQGLVEGQADP